LWILLFLGVFEDFGFSEAFGSVWLGQILRFAQDGR